MTTQRTSKRDLSVVLFLAVALSSSTALAQVGLSYGGGAAPQAGAPAPLIASVPLSCLPNVDFQGKCFRGCSHPGGTLRVEQTFPSTVPQGQITLSPHHDTYQCVGALRREFLFNTSGSPAGIRQFRAQFETAAGTDSSPNLSVQWVPATSSTSLVVALPPAPVLSDMRVTLTATVTGFAPSGRVNFKNEIGGSIVATATNSPFEITPTLDPGTYNLVAEYEGDANNDSSSSSAAPAFTVTISPAHAAAVQTIIQLLLLDD